MRGVLIGLNRAANLLPTALLISLVGIGAMPATAATCASLAGLRLPDTTITLAEPVSAGFSTVARMTAVASRQRASEQTT